MFDYSQRIERFREDRVRLTDDFLGKLLQHRQANRDRLIARLAEHLPKTRIGNSNFYPQGSVAMRTIIQTKYVDEEYDIDDGLVIPKSQLVNAKGGELSVEEVKEIVRLCLKDDRFKRQPRIFRNCVRVFYADADEEKHHVDFPVYRRFELVDGSSVRELASEDCWVVSDPTQINLWFENVIRERNQEATGRGTQLRELVQLTKRFCRSRPKSEWDMPNGLKVTMLVCECQPSFQARLDLAVRILFEAIRDRLSRTKVILNLAKPGQPELTRSKNDANVVGMLTHIKEALQKLQELDLEEHNDVDSARRAWDWIFRSDGYFKQLDDELARKASELEASRIRAFVIPGITSTGRDISDVERLLEKQKHIVPPPWNMVLEGGATVSAFVRLSGEPWAAFSSNANALPKNCALKFVAKTDIGEPYEVFWQVINTGVEAENASGLRGGYKTDGYGEKALVHEENTLYMGSHTIECFIVRHHQCLARSGRFVVNIR